MIILFPGSFLWSVGEPWFILLTEILVSYCSVTGKMSSTSSELSTSAPCPVFSMLLINAHEISSVSWRASAGGNVVPQGPWKWNLKQKIIQDWNSSLSHTQIYTEYTEIIYEWTLSATTELQPKSQAETQEVVAICFGYFSFHKPVNLIFFIFIPPIAMILNRFRGLWLDIQNWHCLSYSAF